MLRWMILALLITADVVGCIATGMTVSGFISPAISLAIIGAAAYYFRREENFLLCLSALVQMVLFSMSFIVLTYLGAKLAYPLWDRQFAAWDVALGCDLPALKAWLAVHPRIDRALVVAYNSLLPQTALVIIVLGFRNERKLLETFILRMMIAAMIAYMFFVWMPAEGPSGALGITPPGWGESRYIEHVRALRAGEFHHFNFAEGQGLITFPSFHAVWAIFLFLAMRKYRYWNVAFALLEVAVIISTVTAGGHYFVDVPAGFALAAAVCWLTSEKTEELPLFDACPVNDPPADQREAGNKTNSVKWPVHYPSTHQ